MRKKANKTTETKSKSTIAREIQESYKEILEQKIKDIPEDWQIEASNDYCEIYKNKKGNKHLFVYKGMGKNELTVIPCSEYIVIGKNVIFKFNKSLVVVNPDPANKKNVEKREYMQISGYDYDEAKKVAIVTNLEGKHSIVTKDGVYGESKTEINLSIGGYADKYTFSKSFGVLIDGTIIAGTPCDINGKETSKKYNDCAFIKTVRNGKTIYIDLAGRKVENIKNAKSSKALYEYKNSEINRIEDIDDSYFADDRFNIAIAELLRKKQYIVIMSYETDDKVPSQIIKFFDEQFKCMDTKENNAKNVVTNDKKDEEGFNIFDGGEVFLPKS